MWAFQNESNFQALAAKLGFKGWAMKVKI